ncbi:VOC family protein [Actinoplanes sp. L3-i22]|uniref:VOC family protein n=1 Tax=Actinoplanes sp. L3-i22 TaxID=2836373 RepID=UPI001C75B498|nr:VOC family protein [Actinoplanes sp. L3-i22]BCY09148.1 hypothetical protein L3i22_042360 [Actinoplanes sp. L3-i22]
MTISWYAVAIDCVDARTVAAFWHDATGWPIAAESSDTRVVLHPGGGLPQVTFNTVPEPKATKNRLHLDVTTDDFTAEADRLVKLGATRLRDFDGWSTFADVENNEFDLIGS